MKRAHLLLSLLLTFLFVLIMIFFRPTPIQQSITYFPVDHRVAFTETNTTLTPREQKDNDEYILNWSVSGTLDEIAYLRQDISLLFEDGYLRKTLSKWQENAKTLKQEEAITSEDSSHFEAISFHHAETHYEEDQIQSRQKMSHASLYVIDSPMTPFQSFESPTTDKEQEWKQILDHTKDQHLDYTWEDMIRYYQIPRDEYLEIPLVELVKYETKPLPGLSQNETEIAIGRLWEGLYKNYFLGIKGKEGSTLSPIGSVMPLILMDQQATHFIVLIQTKDDQNIQLIQYIK